MMSGLSDLEGTALAKVLRRTIVSALIGGGGAIIVALFAFGAVGRGRDRHRARHGHREPALPRRRGGQGADQG